MKQTQQPPAYDGSLASCIAYRIWLDTQLAQLPPVQRAYVAGRIEQAGLEAIARIKAQAQQVTVSVAAPDVPTLQGSFRELPSGRV